MLAWRLDPRLGRGYRVLVATRLGQAVGYAAIRPMSMLSFNTMAIVDLDWDKAEPDAGHALLAEIHCYSIEAGVDLIAALVSRDARHGKLLRRVGYLKTPASFTWVFHGKPHAGTDITDRTPGYWADGWLAHDFV